MQKRTTRVKLALMATAAFLLSVFLVGGLRVEETWAVDGVCPTEMKEFAKEYVSNATFNWGKGEEEQEACSNYYPPKRSDGASAAEITGWKIGYEDGWINNFMEGFDYNYGNEYADAWESSDPDLACDKYSGDDYDACVNAYDSGFSDGTEGYSFGEVIAGRVCPSGDCGNRDDGDDSWEDQCEPDDADCVCYEQYGNDDDAYDECIAGWDENNGPGVNNGDGSGGNVTNPGPSGVGGYIPEPGGSSGGSSGGTSSGGSSGGSAGTNVGGSIQNPGTDGESGPSGGDGSSGGNSGSAGNNGGSNGGTSSGGASGGVSNSQPSGSNLGTGNTTSILPEDMTIKDLLLLIVKILLYGIGAAAVIGVVIAGLMYLTAGDNEQRMSRSKVLLKEVVIGLLLWAALFSILNWLIPGFNPEDFGF